MPTRETDREVEVDREEDGDSAPDLAVAPVLGIAAALSGLLILLSGRYGYHRDELYFLECGKHLAWGYPDQPPLVPLIARLMSDIDPKSLVVLRLPSALSSGALVVLTALIAREVGGRRAAQVLASASMSVASITLATGHLLCTTTFDLPVWALDCWLIIRILRRDQQRLWLAVGLVTGFGLFDSDLVAFLLSAVVVGLVLVGPRRPFSSKWFYAGGAIAVALWCPYLVWQATHGWPELAVSRSIASGGSGTSVSRVALLPDLLVLVSPYLAPVWIVGLVQLLRDRTLRFCRALGVAWVVLAVVFLVTGGKTYYLGGMFPLLLAAGAQPTIDWTHRGQAKRRKKLVAAAVLLSLTAIPVTLPLLPVGALRHTPIVSLNYDAGETIAWPTYVSEIAAVFATLPAAERASAIVLASNYGEAGAVDHYGSADGLPAVYSGHNGFWYWGPPPATAKVAVAVGFDRGSISAICGNLQLAAHLDNHLGINNDEQGAPVWVCTQILGSWKAVWPKLRDFG